MHGLLTSEQGSITVLAQNSHRSPIYSCRRGGYLGQKDRVGLGRVESLWGLPVIPTDKIVLDRLIALCEYDSSIVERVKAYFGEMTREGQSSLEVLDTALSNTQKAIKRVSKTIVLLTKNNVDDEGNVKAKGPTR